MAVTVVVRGLSDQSRGKPDERILREHGPAENARSGTQTFSLCGKRTRYYPAADKMSAGRLGYKPVFLFTPGTALRAAQADRALGRRMQMAASPASYGLGGAGGAGGFGAAWVEGRSTMTRAAKMQEAKHRLFSLCGTRVFNPLLSFSGQSVRWPHRLQACVPI
jgi:hypothetical protein